MKIFEPSPKDVIKLNNKTCPYCGNNLEKSTTEEEHVIGKRFIPKGMFHGQWNLILKACHKCNSEKSDLEDDISAITLAVFAWFNDLTINELARNEAQRKAKDSISRKTKRKVCQSEEELKLEFPSTSGMKIKFTTTAPPQIDNERGFKLAMMQIAGFFYFITYNKELKKGSFCPGGFYPVALTHYKDWGNLNFKTFMHTVINWDHRWYGVTANGFFKSIIRKHPSAECWSWALEWNKSYRLIGFFGDQETTQGILDSFPPIDMKSIPQDDGTIIKFRKEIVLDDNEDLLFKFNRKK